ncbi:MAG TPA: MoaD/ThiS family protein [Thermotogales bacterium]|nr:MoaD/ThiS family protein [Thermotogales bacterium]
MERGWCSNGGEVEGARTVKVRIHFFATLRLNLGVASMELELEEKTTVGELLKKVSEKLKVDICEKLLEDGKIRRGTMILLNGKNIIHLNGLDTPVVDGDLSIFPPAGGG